MTEQALATFGELYVVSDIHMGGEPGFQILKEGPRLGAFIEHLCAVAPERELALVLNGDVIDSLAESTIDGYVGTRHAESIMERIYGDPAFEPVWNALEKLAHTPRRHLVIAIGNHDIELALPGVERSIVDRLSRGNSAARAAIHFANHGEGFACRVGEARVFCTHGNEVDDFNIVDFSQLSQLGNALNAGRDIDLARWQPNAGTRIVIDVMNHIKRDYPFIDLLKPETKAAIGVLAVLAPDRLGRSLWKKESLEIIKALRVGSRRVSELLSGEVDPVAEIAEPRLGSEILVEAFLGERLRRLLDETRGAPSAPADDLLLEVEEAVARGCPADPGSETDAAATLGVADQVVKFFVGRLRGVQREEALRVALLDWLEDDTTFDMKAEDDTFHKIVARVGPEVDFVVTGHTHLHRALSFGPGGSRYYYNCGTWIRLLGFTTQLLKSPAAFEELFATLAAGDLAALDAAMIPGPGNKPVPLVMERSTAVRIHADGPRAHGELLAVTMPQGKLAVKSIRGSGFTKG